MVHRAPSGAPLSLGFFVATSAALRVWLRFRERSVTPGARALDRKDLAAPLGSLGEHSRHGVELDFNGPVYAGRLEVIWSPIYGKVNLFAEEVFHFDTLQLVRP